jgi:hypothetical protein
MAVQVKGRGLEGDVLPVTLPRLGHGRAVVAAGLVAGILLGWLAYALLTGGEEAMSVQAIQRARAEATVEAYETAWAVAKPSEWRVAVVGTGPGLALVADRQRAWGENGITGTGPGLVTIAELQAGSRLAQVPTGTGPGLEHLPEPLAPEAVSLGAP